MKKKKLTACALVACSAVAGLTQAEPIVYIDADRSRAMETYFFDMLDIGYTSLDITQPVENQLGFEHGPARDNSLLLGFRAEQSSSDISWRSVGFGFGINDRVIVDEGIEVHHIGDPTWDDTIYPPYQFDMLETVGPGNELRTQGLYSVAFTVEYGMGSHSFVGKRYTVGVVLELDDGIHYGFAEFERSTPGLLPSRTAYRPVRWGYESEPNVPMVVPAVCGEADIDRDGALDFFDVSAFLDAFSGGLYLADMNGDAELDFFDVSDFLDAFGAGCP